jgi:hypothetical protein
MGEVFLRKYSYGTWIPNIIGNHTVDKGVWHLKDLNIITKKRDYIKADKSDTREHSRVEKPPSDIMELQLLKSSASAFKKSAERSLEKRKLPDEQIESFLVPAVVDLATSIEFYLKFLLIKRGKTLSGHKLLDLFKSLDLTTRNDIINLTKYNKDEFELLLDQHSNAYIEWRDIHIHGKSRSLYANFEFMRKLIDSLESVVNSS